MPQHTPFRAGRFNQMIRSYNAAGHGPALPEAATIEELQAFYPTSTKEDLRRASESCIDAGQFRGGYVIGTSGTTSAPLILGHRIWGDTSEGTYPYRLMSYLMQNVLSADDVVANLYTPGGLGVLYEGANRFLEPIHATILPVGPMQSIGEGPEYFRLFARLGLNTIMGAPSSIVQFARQVSALGIDLDVRKIVYTGEHFYPAKRDFVTSTWPGAQFYSMFGAVEYGFAAINTPAMAEGVHEILDDWYVFELDEDDNLLVTDLTGPLVPIIRYRIGDKGWLIDPDGPDVGAGLMIGDRSDESFNVAGNAVGHATIRRAVETALGRSERMQVQIATDAQGRDVVTLVLDLDLAAEPYAANRATTALDGIKEIAEGRDRGTVLIRIAGREGLITNWRTKAGAILDLRTATAPATGNPVDA